MAKLIPKKKCPACPAGEKWAVPFADFLSLLLALFIALWAISETSSAKLEALQTAFVKIFDYPATQPVKDKPSKNIQKAKGPSNSKELKELKRLTTSQQETIARLRAALDQQENKVTLDLPAYVQFQRGTTTVQTDDVKDFLKRISELAKRMPPQVKIEVAGYTDNSDKNSLRDYKLGFERSLVVLKYLLENGISEKNLSIKSFGMNKPLNNNPAPTENNRVEIKFKVDAKDANTQRSVLEQIKQFE